MLKFAMTLLVFSIAIGVMSMLLFKHHVFYHGLFILAASVALSLIISFGLSVRLGEASRKSAKLEQMRRDFVANISHELRTPITVIRCSLEALTEKVITDPRKIEEYHNQMLNETKFLERLVNDLLDLSKLQNPDFAIEKDDISICDVVRDAIRSGEQLAKIKNIKIAADISCVNCKITGDYGRLRQMFIIVLDNAIKFSPQNETVEICVSSDKVSIKDNGIGIEAENIPFIFDKIGTGLGLAIAKQIADRHGIKITVESENCRGAKFTFYTFGGSD